MSLASLLIFFTVSFRVDLTSAQCYQCGTTSFTACVSETQYLPCLGSIINWGALTTCPAGTICADVDGSCTASTGTAATCSLCGVCNGASGIACMTATTYAMCDATGTPATDLQYVCPQGLLCDVTGTSLAPCKAGSSTSMLICNPDSTDVTVTPTSAASEASSTASSASEASSIASSASEASSTASSTSQASSTTIDPAAWCSSLRTAGRQADPEDATCKSYIYCRVYNGTLTGSRYTCPGSTLFNPTIGFCTNTYTCLQG